MAKAKSSKKSAPKKTSKPAAKKPVKSPIKSKLVKSAAKVKSATKVVGKAAAKVVGKSKKPVAKKASSIANKSKPVVKSLKTIAKSSPKKTIKANVIVSKGGKKTTQPQAKLNPKVTKSLTAEPITPLDDRVLVQVKVQATHTPGGLIIPDSVITEKENTEGVIIAVGRGHQNKKGQTRPMDVKVGQTILFSKYTGTPVKMGETEYFFIRENEILGIVENSI